MLTHLLGFEGITDEGQNLNYTMPTCHVLACAVLQISNPKHFQSWVHMKGDFCHMLCLLYHEASQKLLVTLLTWSIAKRWQCSIHHLLVLLFMAKKKSSFCGLKK